MAEGIPRSILVVTDNIHAVWRDRLHRQRLRARVLPLGVDSGMLREAVADADCEVMDPQREAAAAQAAVRTFVPAFIDRLPTDPSAGSPTIASVLENGSVNHWWYLEISEKSPLRGRLVPQLYGLALVRLMIDGDVLEDVTEVWLDLEDAALERVLTRDLRRHLRVHSIRAAGRWREVRPRIVSSPWIRGGVMALGTWVLHVLRTIALAAAGVRVAGDGPPALAFFSFFPAWWRSAEGPSPSEWFFEDLAKGVAAHAPVRYLLWYSGGPLWALRHARALRRLQQDRGAVFLQRALGLRAAAAILHPRHVLRAARIYLGPARRLRARFAGFDIRPLVVDELMRSLSSPEFFLDLLVERAVARFVRTWRPRALIYRLEFQPFEKALLAGVAGQAATIGVQHATFGPNYLPYYFPAGSLAGATSPPILLPDLILTTGSAACAVMLANGVPRDRLAITGPVRYEQLMRKRGAASPAAFRSVLGIPDGASVFLVATSVVRDQSLALLVACGRALRRMSPPPVILFKSHPAQRLETAYARWLAPALPAACSHILSPDVHLHEVIPAADGVVVTGSTVALEAMALGVMPVLYENRTLFDAKAMPELEGVCLAASDAEGLVRALTQLVAGGRELEALRARWPAAIDALLGPSDRAPHEQFRQILVERGLIG